jgi:hypothetical protein
MVTKTKLKAGCGVAAVFGAGFLCGAVALFIFLMRIIPLSEGWRDEESKEFVTRHLARQLHLTDAQIAEVKPVVAEVLEARYRHRRSYVEADIELTGTGFEKVLPILTDEQKEKAKKVFSNWKKGKERFTRTGESTGSSQ